MREGRNAGEKVRKKLEEDKKVEKEGKKKEE